MTHLLLGLWRVIWITALILIGLAAFLLCLIVWAARHGNQS